MTITVLSLLTHVIIAAGLLIGTHTDLRRREVPDWLNFGFIVAGLGLGLLATILSWSLQPLLSSVLGLLAGVLIGHLMFYAGQWGGGDAKMIMGIGALLGLDVFHCCSASQLPLLVIFFVNTVLVGAVYGLLWAVFLGFRHRRKVKRAFVERLRSPPVRKARMAVIIACLCLIVLVIAVPHYLFRLVFACFALIVFFMFYTWVFIHVIEHACMVKPVPVRDLVEGDWIFEEVWVKRPAFSPFIAQCQEQQRRALADRQQHDWWLSVAEQLSKHSWARRRKARLRKKLMRGRDELLQRAVKRYGRGVRRLTAKESSLIKRALTGAENDLRRAEDYVQEHGLPSLLGFLRKTYHYAPHESYLVGPQDLGITAEQITRVRERLRQVKVKQGVPFVPSFLVAYVMTMLVGNWLVFLL
ncbi:prepilin peptidase [Candidatus Woesearchaeota archaeon]|nr:prepilin peptidase [Candidatus Woesearchaeota archaeon]